MANLVGFRNSTPRRELETLECAREESFFVVTLNRPPANAISKQLVTELNAALASVESDDAVQSVSRMGRDHSLVRVDRRSRRKLGDHSGSRTSTWGRQRSL